MLQILRKLLRKRSSCQKLTDTNPLLFGISVYGGFKNEQNQTTVRYWVTANYCNDTDNFFACVSVRITSWRIKGRRRYWRYIGDICMVIMQNPCWCVYYDKRLLHDNLAVWYKKDHTAWRKNLRCNDFLLDYTFDNFLHKRSVAHKYKFSYKGVHSANVTNLVFSEQLFDYSSAQPISQQNACVTY